MKSLFYIFTLTIGFVFGIISLICLLNVIVAWHFNGSFFYLSLIYSAIDAIAAYGFIHQKKWLIPLLSTNLVYSFILLNHDHSMTRITLTAANTLICGLIIWKRDLLNGKYLDALFLGTFFVLWLLTTQWGI